PPSFTRYIYNDDRQLTSIARPDGSTISLSYDAAGRVEAITAPGATITPTWDASGRVGAMSMGNSSLTYAYDGSLLTGITGSGAIASTLVYGYDTALRPSSEAINGTSIGFGWDADDLLIQAGALTLTRDPQNGFLAGTTLGGVTDALTYDGFGALSTYTASHAGTAIYSVTYGRDAVGRVNSISENVAGVARARGYGYDEAGRLETVVDGTTPIAEYDYDGNSNRLSHSWPGGTNAATYDAQDRLLTYGDTTYEHSANGELQSATLAGATTNYTYDGFGNLRTVDIAGTTSIEYVIDAQNRRIGKKLNGTLAQGWIYTDQLRIAAETDGTGAIVSRFVYGTRSNAPDYMIRNGATYRILSDHLGSPRLVVNTSDGTILQRIDYDEFGNVTSDTNPGFQPFGFAGGLYDHDTRLLRFGARDYDPRTGRWTAKDPIVFEGGDTNLYGYTWNEPINWIDPSGLNAFCTLPGRIPPFFRLPSQVARAQHARGMPRPTPTPRLRPATTNRPGQPPNPGSGPTEPTPVQNPTRTQRWLQAGKEGAEAIDEAKSAVEGFANWLGGVFPFLVRPADVREQLQQEASQSPGDCGCSI
ncbi:MAG TPA: RHS repeat-associated core domain-containing protein, partial [Thermoanaerobaculia bacterium]